MAGRIPLLETLFVSLLLGSKHNSSGFSRASAGSWKKSLESGRCLLSSSHPLQALQRGIWSPWAPSVVGGETYLQRMTLAA